MCMINQLHNKTYIVQPAAVQIAIHKFCISSHISRETCFHSSLPQSLMAGRMNSACMSLVKYRFFSLFCFLHAQTEDSCRETTNILFSIYANKMLTRLRDLVTHILKPHTVYTNFLTRKLFPERQGRKRILYCSFSACALLSSVY